VTPLSRRKYNSSGLIVEDLAPQREATIQVARSKGIDFIDLNAASTKYLNSIGEAKAVTYNLAAADFTHLNDVGSMVFRDMVSWLLTTTTSLPTTLNRIRARTLLLLMTLRMVFIFIHRVESITSRLLAEFGLKGFV
jgi:hypothetical protein